MSLRRQKGGECMGDSFTHDTDKRFTLRIDKKLFDRISHCAKINRRSVAKEIEQAVEMYVNYAEEQFKDGNHA